MLDMTGLNTKWKVVGREQDSGETERERVCVCVAANRLWHW